jgi:hypothetical protein
LILTGSHGPRNISRTRLARDGHLTVGLLSDVDAFFTDHHRCGDLDAGVEADIVWIDCECGARIVRQVAEEETPPCSL